MKGTSAQVSKLAQRAARVPNRFGQCARASALHARVLTSGSVSDGGRSSTSRTRNAISSSTGRTLRATSRSSIYPLFRFRMVRTANADWYAGASKQVRSYVERVYEHVAEHGPLLASDVAAGGEVHGQLVGMVGRQARDRDALPARSGRPSREERTSQRLYDITERVIPKEYLSSPIAVRTKHASSCSSSPRGRTGSARRKTSPATSISRRGSTASPSTGSARSRR